ncbi:MAG TPA: MBL fold metallo-hydrolase [Polyangia bacterium]
MLFRQLFDPESSTFTYLIADPETREAALIDPVREQIDRDLSLLRELGLRLVYVLDTHVHADHITGADALRTLSGAKTVAGIRSAPCADLHVAHGDQLRLGALTITVLETPGHTDDSVSYLLSDRVFTGDALFVRGTGRTDFQNGNPEALYDSLTKVLFALPDEILVYPGHDYKGHEVSTIGEERRFNPRVGGGKTREQFVALMSSLHLPPPKKLNTAVPANRSCGRVSQES